MRYKSVHKLTVIVGKKCNGCSTLFRKRCVDDTNEPKPDQEFAQYPAVKFWRGWYTGVQSLELLGNEKILSLYIEVSDQLHANFCSK